MNEQPLSHCVPFQSSATCVAATSVHECVFLFVLLAVRDPLRNIVGPDLNCVDHHERGVCDGVDDLETAHVKPTKKTCCGDLFRLGSTGWIRWRKNAGGLHRTTFHGGRFLGRTTPQATSAPHPRLLLECMDRHPHFSISPISGPRPSPPEMSTFPASSLAQSLDLTPHFMTSNKSWGLRASPVRGPCPCFLSPCDVSSASPTSKRSCSVSTARVTLHCCGWKVLFDSV